MTETMDISSKIKEHLPAELAGFIRMAGEAAASKGQRLYLVGGAVRDMLMGMTSHDLDLVAEGDAIALAERLAGAKGGKLVTHRRFGTASLQWKEWNIDMATARSETYDKPGALPSIKPGTITDDLSRRDFTINAMAVSLDPANYGELIDPNGGREDIRRKLIRILHEKSFTDDATRIWRGLRYEQRLNFRLESKTLRLLKRDISMLDTISGDRIRYETECILRERYPEKIFRRADELGVLPKLHHSLKGNGWLAEKFEQARQLTGAGQPSSGMYMALLAYPLAGEEIENLISFLRLPRSTAQTMRDAADLKSRVKSLNEQGLAPSRIYHILGGYSTTAIAAFALACELPEARWNINLFLDKLRRARTALNGDDLKKMGITGGRDIGAILRRIHDARLDGEIITRQDEERFVEAWLANKGHAT